MGALLLMIAVSLFFALRGILGTNKFFEFTTLVAILFLAFFVPQALAIENGSWESFEPWKLWLYMTLCLVMVAAGFASGKRLATNVARGRPAPRPNLHMVVVGCMTLALLGLFAANEIRAISASTDLGTEWTGIVTLWYLLMQTIFYAFTLSWVGYLWGERSQIMVIVLVVSFLTILALVTGAIKRNHIAELAIVLAGGWFFLKHKQPPRALLLAACFLGTVLLHQVGAIRDYVNDGRGNAIEAILAGEPFREFRYFSADDAPELGQALIDLYGINQTGDFEGPASLWNKMVHQYVPGFIVGPQFKESLKVESNISVEDDYRLVSFDRSGATHTGFSDTYRSYWIFGSGMFFLIALFMGWLYGMAMQQRLWAQFYYLILLNDGIMAFTEATDRFIVTLPIVFVLTILFVRPQASPVRFFGRAGDRIPTRRHRQRRAGIRRA